MNPLVGGRKRGGNWKTLKKRKRGYVLIDGKKEKNNKRDSPPNL